MPQTVARRMQSRNWMSMMPRASAVVGNYLGKRMGGYLANQMKSRRTSSRRGVSERSLTFQHDSAVQYRRRRAPRRVRVRARKSYRTFVKNSLKSHGQISRLYNSIFQSGTITPTTLANSQSLYSVGLFGGINASATWGDMDDICTREGLIAAGSGKIHFKSAVLEVQIRNATDTFTVTPSPVVIVVDVYTVYARKEGYDEPSVDWADAMTNQAVPTGTTTVSSPTTLGTTPFDGPGFGSSWLIGKKTTYRIAPGNSVYISNKDPRNHVFNTARFEYDGTARVRMFKGLTRGYLMVIRSADPASATALSPYAYEIVQTKNYHYCIEENQRNAQGNP